MDVGCALGGCTLDDGVHEADGRGALRFVLVADRRPGNRDVGTRIVVAMVGGRLCAHVLDGVSSTLVPVKLHDGAVDRILGGHHGDDPSTCRRTRLFLGDEVHRVAHGQVDLVGGGLDGHDAVLLRHVLGHHLRELGGKRHAGEVDEVDSKLHLERFDELLFRDEPMLDEDLAEAFAAALLKLEGLSELVGRDIPVLAQHIA